MVVSSKTLNKWLVLVLVTLVHMLVVGIPWTVMPVLFTSAAKELNLSLGQIGLLWSMLPIGAAAFALPGGLLGDRLGFVRTVGIGCFAVALANGLRGVSTNLSTLTIFMFLCGASVALVFPNLQRVSGVFFPRNQLGLATGILISGFAIGGVLATALSATVIMPLLGSWRNVLFLYSVLCLLSGIIWFLLMRTPETSPNPTNVGNQLPRATFRKSITSVFRIKDTWLLSAGNLGIVGSFISLNGYLPTYLERTGLTKNIGDTMTSTLFLASIIGAIVIPTLADRLGARKMVLIVSAIITFVGIILLSVASPALFWVLIPLIGCTTQGIGTLVIMQTIQTKEIGLVYAGTALGLIGCFANVGGFIMPIIGGKLAESNQTWPFILWALFSLSAAGCFALLKDTNSQ